MNAVRIKWANIYESPEIFYEVQIKTVSAPFSTKLAHFKNE